MNHKSKLGQIFELVVTKVSLLVIFVFITVLSLLPLVWGFVTSIKPTREILSFPPKLIGFTISLEHYDTVFRSGFFRSMLMTVIYSVASIILGLTLGLMM